MLIVRVSSVSTSQAGGGAARDLDANRNLPAPARALGGIDEEALLLERHRGLVVHARERDVEQRHARLVDEGRQDALDRLAGAWPRAPSRNPPDVAFL